MTTALRTSALGAPPLRGLGSSPRGAAEQRTTHLLITVNGSKTITADVPLHASVSALFDVVHEKTRWPLDVFRLTNCTGQDLLPLAHKPPPDNTIAANLDVLAKGNLRATSRLVGGARAAVVAASSSSQPHPPAQQAAGQRTLRIGTGNAGGLVKPERLAKALALIHRQNYDIVLLQETNLTASKASRRYLGDDFVRRQTQQRLRPHSVHPPSSSSFASSPA